ncbi:MAG: hypothetical protein ABSD42_14280 [Candidatus Bathyarchaeia archaeon]|jgi:uncharacterized integral membrane protein
MNRWLLVSILLIAVGIIFLVVNQVFYVSKLDALAKAFWAWSKNQTLSSSPNPQTYGVTQSSGYISWLLGFTGAVFVFAGALSIFLVFINRIFKSSKEAQKPKQNPF